MGLFDFGTGQLVRLIFPFVPPEECVNNGASMRNHSSALLSLRRAMLLSVAGAAVIAFCPSQSRAQCSGDDTADSYGCQLQQAAPLPSTTQSSASPAVLTMQEQPQPGTARADRSTEASADDSLPVGSSYTEEASAQGKKTGRPTLPAGAAPRASHRVSALCGGHHRPHAADLWSQPLCRAAGILRPPRPGPCAAGHGGRHRGRTAHPHLGTDQLQRQSAREPRGRDLPSQGRRRACCRPAVFRGLRPPAHRAGAGLPQLRAECRYGRDSLHPGVCDRSGAAAGRVHGERAQHAGGCGFFERRSLRGRFHAPRPVEARGQGGHGLRSLCAAGEGRQDRRCATAAGRRALYSRRRARRWRCWAACARPAIYELRGQETIAELLDAAGGRTAIASGGRISVERIEDHARRRAFELAADAAGLATLLADGDIVRIDPIVSSYRETVTLRGSLANPGRFLWHAGMRLSDLMPDRRTRRSRTG